MLRRLAPLLISSSFVAGCLFSEDFEQAPTTNNVSRSDAGNDAEGSQDAAIDQGTDLDSGTDASVDAGDPYSDYALIEDVTLRDGCSLFGTTTFINAEIDDALAPISCLRPVTARSTSPR